MFVVKSQNAKCNGDPNEEGMYQYWSSTGKNNVNIVWFMGSVGCFYEYCQ